MSNFLQRDWDRLQRRHYLRRARATNYWFDFSINKLADFRIRYSDNFCLVVSGSDDIDDAYVMPFGEVSDYFTDDACDGRRWYGTIIGHEVRLGNGGGNFSARRFHNAFHFLDLAEAIPARPRSR
jgi:hypothetical protein